MSAQVSPMPTARSGLIKTMNQMGYMTSSLDPFSQAFVAFAPKAPGPVLDIGAAYGVASLAALAAGATVVANDLDPRHLAILAERAGKIPGAMLSTVAGAFPEELTFANGQFGAVLICRVLHFFPGERVDAAMRKIAGWLAPGGKLFAITESPFIGTIKPFEPEFHQRVARGERWPGYLDGLARFSPRAADVPQFMNFLDPATLARAASDAGLRVEAATTFGRPEYPQDMRHDGREGTGLIAIKV